MISGLKLDITDFEPITAGWSEDKKFCVTAAGGTKYLLRVSPISRYEARKALYAMLKQVSQLDIPICTPVDFGKCHDGVFMLQSWINGDDLEKILSQLSETEQYVLGLKSGEIARTIHTLPAPASQETWATRFNRKTDLKIEKYQACGLRFSGDEHVIDYITQNRHLLDNRPQCFQHGDYHVGNMMLENGELVIIDFDRYDFGDPWEEFNRIVWSAKASPAFATGQLRGYFGGDPPLEFFQLLAFYIASNTLSSIYWAIPFGQAEIDIMMKQAHDVLTWFDHMRNPIPTWYQKDLYIQRTDEVPYRLKSPFDFSFLSKYGKVFKVYDDQDSGNICFCMKDDDQRYFVKFAGAPTNRMDISTDKAIANLKRTVPVYQDLAHSNLVRLIDAEEIGGGYALVFEWVDAECMSNMYPRSRQRFLQASTEEKLQIFSDILSFHAHVINKGYVSIDFYDGSIMYNFADKKTIICDIDFYTKTPYINNMGRMWGSSRFMSPEEYKLGASIDEVTTVYTMGATAFALFGDERDRSIEKWRLNHALFEVARKAVSADREKRHQSINELILEWYKAID